MDFFMIRTDLFVNPIWEGNIQLNNKLLSHFFDKSKELNYIASGKSSQNGSEQTQDLCISKEFSDTKKRIENYYIMETGLKVEIGNAWICKNITGSFNDLHLHGNSDISGVYYISAPNDCGGLVFRNPNDCVHMADNFIKDPCWWGKYTKKVKTGMIIFFPSYLPHKTEVNKSKKPRLALSFNMRYI
jgi:uncharacterized protein (TIGR02466 family)|tara:strand:+ start:262 stop:822 length:561 start_codon:yes stop_codon:yes gene_type:complete